MLKNLVMKLKLSFLDACSSSSINAIRDEFLQKAGYSWKSKYYANPGASAMCPFPGITTRNLAKSNDNTPIDYNFSAFLEKASNVIAKRALHTKNGRLSELQAKQFYPLKGLS